MRIVVVGGSGNVGTAVMRRLTAESGCDVVGVSRRAPNSDEVSWHEIDIGHPRSEPLLRAVFTGADAVVHAAWLVQPSHNERFLRRTNVDGSARVFDAAVHAGVRHVVYLSSIGAYSPAPKGARTGETWPTSGVRSSSYSQHKTAVERLLHSVEADNPELLVTRLRPALILQYGAASEIQRYFLGALVPAALFRSAAARRLPILPLPRELVLQFVHADDVALAVLAALRSGFTGAVNLAAEPVMTPAELARLVGARHLPVPPWLLRSVVAGSWALRLQPTEPGWIDLALSAPVMSTARARAEWGWHPARTAPEAVGELLRGLADGAGDDTPPLAPRR